MYKRADAIMTMIKARQALEKDGKKDPLERSLVIEPMSFNESDSDANTQMAMTMNDFQGLETNFNQKNLNLFERKARVERARERLKKRKQDQIERKRVLNLNSEDNLTEQKKVQEEKAQVWPSEKPDFAQV